MPHQPLINRYHWFWIITTVVFLGLFWLLRPILTPFIVAIIVAYCLDPLCDWLEKYMSRTLAVSVVTLVFVLAICLAALLIVPLFVAQVLFLINQGPEILKAVQSSAESLATWFAAMAPGGMFDTSKPVDFSSDGIWESLRSLFGDDAVADFRTRLTDSAGSIFSVVLTLAQSVWSGSLAIVNAISLMFLTPFVAFYLLRDWDRMVAHVDALVPHGGRQKVRSLALEVDRTLAGFIRGQFSLMLAMSVFYCTGLFLVGLDFWLLIGVTAGMLSFVPYVGVIVGFGLSVGLAFYQFDSLLPVFVTYLVFQLGQLLEGYVLQPKLVGENIGLGAVWIIFSLMAGGTLLGFVGILIAVPLAGIIGVFVRFIAAEYRDSEFYGKAPEDNPVAAEIGAQEDTADYVADDTSSADDAPAGDSNGETAEA